MLLSTLVSQFPSATGLKYRNEDSHSMRAVRLNQGVLSAPDGGWGERLFLAVLPSGPFVFGVFLFFENASTHPRAVV